MKTKLTKKQLFELNHATGGYIAGVPTREYIEQLLQEAKRRAVERYLQEQIQALKVKELTASEEDSAYLCLDINVLEQQLSQLRKEDKLSEGKDVG